MYEVLSRFPVSNDAQRDGHCRRRMPVIDLAESDAVPGSDPLGQKPVILERC